MARTLKAQHGTAKVSWGDSVVVLRKLCVGTPPEKLKEELCKVAPALHDKVADWPRMRQIVERVTPERIDLVLAVNGRYGINVFPQTWFRQPWALLEAADRQRPPVGNVSSAKEAQLVYVLRRLLIVEELATKKMGEQKNGASATFGQCCKVSC